MSPSRRRVLLAAAMALLVAPFTAGAQVPAKAGRVVMLSDYLMGRWPATRVNAFRQGLRDLGWQVREDPGRGWRRVVASPPPRGIVAVDVRAPRAGEGYVGVARRGGGR